MKTKRIFINKKGQMKIQQMAFMLIAITLFFALVGLLVLMFISGNLKNIATQTEEDNAVALVEKLSNSPEFSCENAFQSKSNCIDADKVMMLKENKKYEDFWQVAGIEIVKVFPEENGECTEQNYPDCKTITILSKEVNKISTSSFVSLCRKEKDATTGRIYDKCEIAKLLVYYEVK